MNIWFTSDHHFGHENIIKYTKRPFGSVLEMDETMIARWNERVKPHDWVYHLGDFCLGNQHVAGAYFAQLNGSITVIPGGHDKMWKRKVMSGKYEAVTVKNYMTMGNIGGVFMVLCHYPMLSWEKSHYGSVHLHGHTHGTIPIRGASGDLQLPPKERGGQIGKRMDVGVDGNNFYPYLLEEVIEALRGQDAS